MIGLWCSEGDEDFVLSRSAIRTTDEELYVFGDGIYSQMRCRPRPLRLYRDWKSAQVKDFILSYSLVVLDGILPEPFLSGWTDFVALVDLCWRPVLQEQDMEEIGRLSRKSYAHFEHDYYQYNRDRIHMCKYVFHVLLHLEDNIRECGPPLVFSQYGMERFISWILGRLNARKLSAASLFKNALLGEANIVRFPGS